MASQGPSASSAETKPSARQSKAGSVPQKQPLFSDDRVRPILRKQEVMLSQIAAFDRQVDRRPTQPLLHRTGRFLFIKEGMGSIMIQNRLCYLEPGVICVLMPWQVTQIMEVSQSLRYDLIAFNYSHLLSTVKHSYRLTAEAAQMRDVLYNVHSLRPREEQKLEFERLFEAIGKTLSETATYYRHDSNVTDSQTDLAHDLREMISNKRANPAHSQWQTVRLTSQLIELVSLYVIEAAYGESTIARADAVPEGYGHTQIFQYLFNNLETYPTLRSVAEKFMMSESTLNRHIRKLTGEGYADVLKDMKCVKIIEYLLYSDFTLEEIALLLGYRDASFISKLIYEKTGFHATEIRSQPENLNLLHREQGMEMAREIALYISSNASSDLTVNEVADQFDLSPNKLNRLLQQAFDKNFVNLLNQMRLNRACVLLLSTDLEVTEIAFRVGYNSTKTFIRNFKSLYQRTPTQFRATIRLQEETLPSDP